MAGASNVPFTRLELEIEGTVGRKDSVTRFTEIVLRPCLTVPPGANHERAKRAMEKAEKTCLVSASLAVPIQLDSAVFEEA